MPTLAAIHANAPSTTEQLRAVPRRERGVVRDPRSQLQRSSGCRATTCRPAPRARSATSARARRSRALPVGNGAKFSGSLMSHAGIASNCAACHVPAGTAASLRRHRRASSGMPPTSPMGAGSHIPSGTTCETCHLASLPTGLIAASATKTAPGTAFATPAPGSAQIHTGVTSGCTSCHEASYVWMGVSAYPISPSFLSPGAQYTGFQTRPRTAAGTYNVADAAHPSTGDCAQCHGNTSAFTGVDKPANHIPYASGVNCDACHISTDYSVMPTLAAIHANAPSTTSNCAQCHGSAAASFAIPAANFTHRRAAEQPPADQRLVRDLPRRRGLVDHEPAGGQRGEVQRLADEPCRASRATARPATCPQERRLPSRALARSWVSPRPARWGPARTSRSATPARPATWRARPPASSRPRPPRPRRAPPSRPRRPAAHRSTPASPRPARAATRPATCGWA